MHIELGKHLPDLEMILSKLDEQRIIKRIWDKDHTVWKSDPTEITDRLGWLTVINRMRGETAGLEAFSQEVRDAGFKYVVLLGMGGSSLGPEVLRRTFGKRDGYPELIVLDSIDPDWIKQVQDYIDPAHTLLLVSSKSGTTIESVLLFEYFKSQIESAVGVHHAGSHFAVVTDPDTPCAKQAWDEGFRRVFENPSDIGGRYSVLSFFGLVPAVLAGIDIRKLLDCAEQMKNTCMTGSAGDNHGCLLGAIMGGMALKGRDKLTLITSPGISTFGLWAEQLIAESTGKEGKGIIPISGEPLVEPQHYGEDRFFIFLRLDNDDNTVVDSAAKAIRDSGQPMVILQMQDKYDIGAEFFRWEFAVAVAGSLLGVQPFDQPDVQSAKSATADILKVHAETGSFPAIEAGHSLENLLTQASHDKYLSIMAYIVQSSETEQLIADFRREIIEKHHIATTFGYGPRFLHSTGQMHKGGPGSGLSLQLTVDHTVDLPIPGRDYSFGQLTNAQAMGDLAVLQQSGRSVVNLHFSGGDDSAAKGLFSYPD